jgi:hypothetical protein
MKKSINILALLLLGILPFMLSCGGGGGGSSGSGDVAETIGNNITLTRVTISGTRVASGYLTIPFTKTDESKFINVVVDLNNDGKWDSYSVNGKEQAEWLVQNMLAKISPAEPNSFSFVFNDFDADGRKNLKARLILSNSPIDSSNYPDGWDGTVSISAISQKDFVISEIATDAGNLFLPDPDGLRSGGFSGMFIPKSHIQTSNIDVLNTDVPDLTQGLNECVPTSAANAILWLSKVYGFEDKMPASIESLLSELKSDFNWTNDGVIVNSDFLSGKQNFVGRHG